MSVTNSLHITTTNTNTLLTRMMLACAVVQVVGITGLNPFCTTDSATCESDRLYVAQGEWLYQLHKDGSLSNLLIPHT